MEASCEYTLPAGTDSRPRLSSSFGLGEQQESVIKQEAFYEIK
jgi:hypothetical protein